MMHVQAGPSLQSGFVPVYCGELHVAIRDTVSYFGPGQWPEDVCPECERRARKERPDRVPGEPPTTAAQ